MANDQTTTDSNRPDPLALRSLPDLEPPEGLWTAIENSLDAQSAKNHTNQPWVPLAMAATVSMLALCIALLRGMHGPVAPVEEPFNSLARLQTVSAALESQLEDVRYGVVSASTADSVARLEQELAWLDAEISDTPDSLALWAERVALLGEINQRYIRSDWRSEMMLASY